MSYIVGRDPGHPKPALKRLDHIICRVPDIEAFHTHFRDVLGFPEAWPGGGRFWPEGRTSGIALGGINLEFIQPDRGAPEKAVADTLVFEPTSLEVAEEQFSAQGVKTHRFDKVEPDPALLALRGFEGEALKAPQRICENLLLDDPFPIPMFLCDYTPPLKQRLVGIPTAFGKVLSVEIQLLRPGSVWKLAHLGYLGNVEITQSEVTFGEPRLISISLENGPLDLKGVDPGFRFA